MKKPLFLLSLLFVTASAQAQTQLTRLYSSLQDKTEYNDVLNTTRDNGAVWKSTFEGQTATFNGYLISTSDKTKWAVRSDDGVTVTSNGTSILGNVGKPQHWPDTSSFTVLGILTKGVPLCVNVSYKNTVFSGGDADGITLATYDGTAKLVTIDLTLKNLTNAIGEDSEEALPAYVALNDDWDEKQLSPTKVKLADNVAGPNGAAIVPTDNELADGSISLSGQGEKGKWKLNFPDSVKVWIQDGTNWKEVPKNTFSSDVTLPLTIPLKIEGISIAPKAGDVEASFQLSDPASQQAITDKAQVAVFKVNAQATGLKMGTDNYLVSGQTDTTPELDEEDPGVYVHLNLDDDNHSDASTSRISNKHPGADYNENVADSREDDLLPLKLSYSGLVSGKVSLSVSGLLRLWNKKAKGAANLVAPYVKNVAGVDTTISQLYWNLDDSIERQNFNLVKDSLFVEGLGANENGSVTFTFAINVEPDKLKTPIWQPIGSDVLSYHSIAANDGDQPFNKAVTPDGSSNRGYFLASWPRLVNGEYSILAPATGSYNCWAWSTERPDAWIGRPLPIGVTKRNNSVTGVTEIDIGQLWGGHTGAWTETDFDAYYEAAGREPGDPPLPYKFVDTKDINEAEILLYEDATGITHGARIHFPTKSGQGKWRMFESKLGRLEKIEHTFDQLDGGDYGGVFKMYKRMPR